MAPVVLIEISPYSPYAELSQTAIPVAIPSSGEMMAAALDCRFHSMVKEVGKIPGHVKTPEPVSYYATKDIIYEKVVALL